MFLTFMTGFDIINATCCSNDLCNGPPGEYNVTLVDDAGCFNNSGKQYEQTANKTVTNRGTNYCWTLNIKNKNNTIKEYTHLVYVSIYVLLIALSLDVRIDG